MCFLSLLQVKVSKCTMLWDLETNLKDSKKIKIYSDNILVVVPGRGRLSALRTL